MLRIIHRSRFCSQFSLVALAGFCCCLAHNSVAKNYHGDLAAFLGPASRAQSPSNGTFSYTFSGDNPDTINYLQLCVATDNICASCNATIATITGGPGLPYTRVGTSYNIQYSSIADYLKQSGYANGNYNVGMYLQGASNVNSCTPGYCTSNSDTVGQKLCMSVNYNGNSVTSGTQQDNGAANLSTAKYQSIYVADQNYGIYRCTPNSSSGVLSSDNCVKTSRSNAAGLTFASVSGTNYAYTALGNSTVSQCNVTPGSSGGGLSSCATAGPASVPWNAANGVAFATASNQTQFAYVADTGYETVWQCTLSGAGAFSSCIATAITDWEAWGLDFAMVNNSDNYTTYAYVAEFHGGTTGAIGHCRVTESGTFSNCADPLPSGVTFWSPQGVAVINLNGTPALYVADSSGYIWQCTINSTTGALSSCAQNPASAQPWIQPMGIAFALVNGSLYAYVSDSGVSNGLVYSCTVDTTSGAFSNCTSGTYTSEFGATSQAVAASYYY